MAQLDSLMIICLREKLPVGSRLTMVIVEAGYDFVSTERKVITLDDHVSRLVASEHMDIVAEYFRFTTRDRVWHDGKVTNIRYRR